MTIALVSGAGSGIGRATALMLAQRGLEVICVGRTRGTLDATVKSITDTGGKARTVVADCASRSDINQVADDLRGHSILALVHAAGRNMAKAFEDISPDELSELFAANVAGPFFLTQALLPCLAEGAGIVFVGSVAAIRGRARHAAYGATKAGLIGLTVNLAAELAPRVRVNCVSPGPTRTAMLRSYLAESTRDLSEEQRAKVQVSDAARILLGRVANPEEVAHSIVHLALDATAVTGADFPVDVGYAAS